MSILFSAALLGCEETRGGLGDECLRNDDCLSQTCSARKCVSESPVTNQREVPVPTPTTNAGTVDAGAGTKPNDAGSGG